MGVGLCIHSGWFEYRLVFESQGIISTAKRTPAA